MRPSVPVNDVSLILPFPFRPIQRTINHIVLSFYLRYGCDRHTSSATAVQNSTSDTPKQRQLLRPLQFHELKCNIFADLVERGTKSREKKQEGKKHEKKTMRKPITDSLQRPRGVTRLNWVGWVTMVRRLTVTADNSVMASHERRSRRMRKKLWYGPTWSWLHRARWTVSSLRPARGLLLSYNRYTR